MECSQDSQGTAKPLIRQVTFAEFRDRAERWRPHARAGTIYAGPSEVQRNIIAEQVLGLPR